MWRFDIYKKLEWYLVPHNVPSFANRNIFLRFVINNYILSYWIHKNKHLLLCTVNQLVFVWPLEACLYSFIIPELFCMFKEFLKIGNVTNKWRFLDLIKKKKNFFSEIFIFRIVTKWKVMHLKKKKKNSN